MDTLDRRDLDTCVRCGLCLSACPTYRLTGNEGYSPRGRILAARVLEAEGGSPMISEYMDTCLGCRACEAVCPSGVPYGRILEGARASTPSSGGPLRRLADTLLLWVVAKRWRLSVASLPLWAVQRLRGTRVLGWLARRGFVPRPVGMIAGLPSVRLADLTLRMSTNYVPPDGTKERGQVVLFTGCVQDAWSRRVHWATIGVLTRVGRRVRVPHGQVCCGALHAHAGRSRWARKLAHRNLEPLSAFEGPVVVDSAGCGAKLKEYGDVLDEAEPLARRVRDVSEVVRPSDVRRLRPRPPEGLERVAVQDPCHLGFAQGITSEPRRLLEAAGYTVVELDDAGRCCGAAGTYAAFHPEWAEPLRAEKLDAIERSAPDAVASANPGCAFWLGAAPGAPRIFHPIELVAMAIANADEEVS